MMNFRYIWRDTYVSQELDLRDIFRIVRRRSWLIALVVLLICLLVGGYSVFIKKPVFEASTKIVVNQTPSQTSANQLDLNQINTNIQMINTYKEVIKTPAILDVVVANYPQFQLNAEELSNMVNVNSVNNTQVMTVIVRDTDYVRAAGIANAISDVFQQEIPDIFNVENVSILNKAKTDPPVRPEPVEPNFMLNMAIGFVVSLMIGLALAFLLEYLDDTIKTEDDIKNILDMPTLAMITRIRQEDIAQKRSTSANIAKLPKRGDDTHATLAK